MDESKELEGLKQAAPVIGYSIRQIQRYAKQLNIDLPRAGLRGHIKMTYEKAREIKHKILNYSRPASDR